MEVRGAGLRPDEAAGLVGTAAMVGGTRQRIGEESESIAFD